MQEDKEATEYTQGRTLVSFWARRERKAEHRCWGDFVIRDELVTVGLSKNISEWVKKKHVAVIYQETSIRTSQHAYLWIFVLKFCFVFRTVYCLFLLYLCIV